MSTNGLKSKAVAMYVDGFRNMTVGRKLWLLIFIKLIVLFLVLKVFFFPDLLSVNFSSDTERADAVRSALTKQ